MGWKGVRVLAVDGEVCFAWTFGGKNPGINAKAKQILKFLRKLA